MGTQVTMLVLRLIHILAGVFWVGGAIILARFLFPSVRAVGSSGGAIIQEIGQRRKLPLYMNLASSFTLLSGIGMYWRMSTLSDGGWARSPMGMTLGVGAAIAIAAWIIGFTVARPTGERMGVLGAEIASSGGPPSTAQQEAMAGLQGRMALATNCIALLLVLVTASMAIARYM